MPDALTTRLRAAGFTGPALSMARAISMAESKGNSSAHNFNPKTGDDSYGDFQINMLGALGPARRKQFGLSSDSQLLNPSVNDRIAYKMSKGGTDWSAWSTYKTGAYKKYFEGKAFEGTVPVTGKGIDTMATAAQALPGSPNRQALVASLLGSLDSFSKTGKVGDIHEGITSALDTIQEAKGSARATWVADENAGPVRDESGLITEAKKWLGTPYSWGGGGTKGPTTGTGRGAKTVGFDCSSFLQYLEAKKGVRIPRTTYDQLKTGQAVDPKALRPGDAVFFHDGGHVGMYIGNDQFIHAPHTGDVVKISKLSTFGGFVGARRYG